MQSNNDEEIDKLMNDFDTEFITPEEIKLTLEVYTPSTNRIYNFLFGTIAYCLQSTQCECFDIRSKCLYCWPRDQTHKITRDKQKERKKPEENTPVTWKRKVSLYSQENCLLKGRVANQFGKSASAFNIFEQIIILDVLIEILTYLFFQTCTYI